MFPSTEPAASPAEKLEVLRGLLREMQSVLVCYSGGIDSAFVLAVAHAELGSRALGVTAVSPSLPARELEDAVRIAKRLGAAHRLLESNEIERPEYVQNAPDRCFHCKSELYSLTAAKRAEFGLDVVVNGTNLDDLGDYRPGLQAATDNGVRSPLVEARFTKADVRAAAKLIGMDVWDKPAAACLSSRIPYGTSVTRERLQQIGNFEAELHDLGFRQIRVRWHDQIARIELDLAEMGRLLSEGTRERIVEAGKRHGFRYVTLDLGGYRTGSLNEMLTGRSLKLVP